MQYLYCSSENSTVEHWLFCALKLSTNTNTEQSLSNQSLSDRLKEAQIRKTQKSFPLCFFEKLHEKDLQSLGEASKTENKSTSEYSCHLPSARSRHKSLRESLSECGECPVALLPVSVNTQFPWKVATLIHLHIVFCLFWTTIVGLSKRRRQLTNHDA